MSTTIRPEVSEKNENWISRHRYYELKHFCLQYPMWKKTLSEKDGWRSMSGDINAYIHSNDVSDPTYAVMAARSYCLDRVDLVETVAKEAGDDLSEYLLKAVTEGLSYDYLKTKMNIPCCKDVYYNLYRRFFRILSDRRE